MTCFRGCCRKFRTGRIHGQCGAIARELLHLGRSQKLADSLHHSPGIVATSSLPPLVELFGEVGRGLSGKRGVCRPQALPAIAVATAACREAACRITPCPQRRCNRLVSGFSSHLKRRVMKRHRLPGTGVQLLSDPAHLPVSPPAVGISDHLPLEIASVEAGQSRSVGPIAPSVETMAGDACVPSARSTPAECNQLTRRLEAVGRCRLSRATGAEEERRYEKHAAGHGAATRAATGWFLPMLLIAACKPPPDERMQMPQANAAQGMRVIERVGCASCHRIPGIEWPQGKVGPPLMGLRERALIAGRLPNRPDILAAYIRNAPALVPDTGMPAMPVNESEARDVAAYLYDKGDQ